MERKNANDTLTPLPEGSGSSHVTTFQNFTAAYTTSPSTEAINNDVRRKLEYTKAWDSLDITTASVMDTKSKDELDNLATLQTNILLIAVLIVCFVTLASVVAMCACLLRRYCKKRRISQASAELYHTTLVSKATSISGLNVAHEYYSTKVEKKNNFSPNIITPNKCEKSISCELDCGRNAESIIAPKFNPVSPSCQAQTEEAVPIYFRMKNVLTSTPASMEPQHIIDLNVSHDGVDTRTTVTPTSIYTSALSNQQVLTHNSQPDKGTSSNHVTRHGMTKGPLTQSVSWFVPLSGIQREPLRHSVVELKLMDDDVNIEHVNQHLEGQKTAKLKMQNSAPLKEEGEDAATNTDSTTTSDLQLQDYDDQAMNSTAVAENIPLMNNKENITPNPGVQSLPSKRSRFKSAVSEDRSPEDEASNGRKTRSRSLSSPDENTMWQQREERPVLFLGSGVK